MTDHLSERRDHVIDQLSAGYAGDLLEVEELERRLALVQQAATSAELDALVTDLAPPPAATTALIPSGRLRVVMGSVERKGRWTVPRQLATRVVCGHLELDLRDAVLAAGVTTIEVHVTMGHVEVIVPPGLAVEVDASSLLASIDDHSEPAAPDAPIVRITGRVRLGNVEVATLRPGETRREARRRHRRARRWARRHARHHAWWLDDGDDFIPAARRSRSA